MPPLDNAEFELHISGAIKGASVSLSKLMAFASDRKCLPAQYKRMVSVMYWHLNANKIPRGQIMVSLDEFGIPSLCLTALGMTLPAWLSCNEISASLLRGLINHWNDIREWLLFLHRQIITHQEVDIHLQLSCKIAVVEFFGLVRDRLLLDWSRRITTDRPVMRMITELWFLEAKDPRFHSWSPNIVHQRESAVFNACILIAHEAGTTIDWENILHVFNNDPEVFATTVLDHLEREMAQKTVDLHCIGWDLHIISATSFQDNIRLALFRHGVIRAVTRVLPFIVSQKTPVESMPLAARCVVNASVFLNLRLDDLDGTPLVIEAINSDLIPSLMKCEPLLPFTDNVTAREQPITLLETVLAKYTLYRSVLRPMLLSMDVVESSRIDLHLIKGGQLHQAWLKLKEVVAERRRLLRHDIADGYHIQSCQNPKCGRAGEIGSFKRCGGCLHAFYCSKACQRDDWRGGRHKSYCNGIHGRYLRTGGQMAGLRQKDIQFLDQIIIAELRKHKARIRAHHLKINVVEFNFDGKEVDTTFDSKRVDPTPFGIKCSCEKSAHERWNKTIEKAKEAREPLILARVHIPSGMSRKIILRALPLRCILEDVSHTYHREDETGMTFPSHLSLMYTCCGENGNEKMTMKRRTM